MSPCTAARGRAAGLLASMLAAWIVACAPAPPPSGGSVGPQAAAAAVPPAPARAVELARPAPDRPAPAPSEGQGPTTPSELGPDLADLGPFEVETWAQAARRADARVARAEARAELERLRTEIDAGP
ncbi:MAG: hypothetical protein JNK02_13395 [Planctomycetes bacterium]|nr:hypothetical protein [Planctomycetota bacterium]